jgi:hypothetical protein
MKSPKTLVVLILIAAVAIMAGCEKSDPTAAGDSTIVVTANPGSINMGSADSGTSRIQATVLTKDSRPSYGVVVHFSTDTGTLKSNGKGITTDVNGIAEDVLTLTSTDTQATVTAQSGSKSATVTVTVGGSSGGGPTARIVLTPTGSQQLGVNVQFDGRTSSAQSGNQVTFWTWTLTYSDGSPPETIQGATADKQNFLKSFSTPRTVTVKLVVTDNAGLSGQTTTSISILNFTPTASFTVSATSVPVNTQVNMDASASADDPRYSSGHIVRYDWDYGDGQTLVNQTTATTTHSYTTTGNFQITLKVYDNGDTTGCDATTHLCSNYATAQLTKSVTVQ